MGHLEDDFITDESFIGDLVVDESRVISDYFSSTLVIRERFNQILAGMEK